MTLIQRLEKAGQYFDVELFQIAGTAITAATAVVFALIVLGSWVASLAVQRAIARGLKMRGVTDEGSVGVAGRLTHYLVIAVGLGVGLQTIGIDLSAMFAAGAVFAIGLGFAMQNMAQNFVSGVILLLERSIKPGDVLKIGDQLVRVKTMGARATIARTLDEEDIIVPNADIVQSSVTNYTLRDSHYRLRCPVGVTYDSDMAKVRSTLEATADALPWRSANKEPLVLLTDFGDSAVVFEVSVWMDDPWAVRRRRSDLNEAIWWALKEQNLVIAFPQVDVHLDAPVIEAIRDVRAAS